MRRYMRNRFERASGPPGMRAAALTLPALAIDRSDRDGNRDNLYGRDRLVEHLSALLPRFLQNQLDPVDGCERGERLKRKGHTCVLNGSQNERGENHVLLLPSVALVKRS